MMMEDRFLKRLRKKARKGLRGWPIATIAFYGPNLSQATKVTVGIVPSENAEVEELRDWKVDDGEIRVDPRIAREILEFIEERRVLSVAMTDGIIGCPHQEATRPHGLFRWSARHRQVRQNGRQCPRTDRNRVRECESCADFGRREFWEHRQTQQLYCRHRHEHCALP